MHVYAFYKGSPRDCASRVLSVIGSQMVVRREGKRKIASEFVWCLHLIMILLSLPLLRRLHT